MSKTACIIRMFKDQKEIIELFHFCRVTCRRTSSARKLSWLFGDVFFDFTSRGMLAFDYSEDVSALEMIIHKDQMSVSLQDLETAIICIRMFLSQKIHSLVFLDLIMKMHLQGEMGSCAFIIVIKYFEKEEHQ